MSQRQLVSWCLDQYVVASKVVFEPGFCALKGMLWLSLLVHLLFRPEARQLKQPLAEACGSQSNRKNVDVLHLQVCRRYIHRCRHAG